MINQVLPSDAGDVSPLHGEEELLLLVGEDPHLAMGPRIRVILRHPVYTVALLRTQEKNHKIKIYKQLKVNLYFKGRIDICIIVQ